MSRELASGLLFDLEVEDRINGFTKAFQKETGANYRKETGANYQKGTDFRLCDFFRTVPVVEPFYEANLLYQFARKYQTQAERYEQNHMRDFVSRSKLDQLDEQKRIDERARHKLKTKSDQEKTALIKRMMLIGIPEEKATMFMSDLSHMNNVNTAQLLDWNVEIRRDIGYDFVTRRREFIAKWNDTLADLNLLTTR